MDQQVLWLIKVIVHYHMKKPLLIRIMGWNKSKNELLNVVVRINRVTKNESPNVVN